MEIRYIKEDINTTNGKIHFRQKYPSNFVQILPTLKVGNQKIHGSLKFLDQSESGTFFCSERIEMKYLYIGTVRRVLQLTTIPCISEEVRGAEVPSILNMQHALSWNANS